MTLKAGRLGIGTSEPRAALDVRGRIMREYNPGEIIEELNSICDGSTVAVLSGSYQMANVTAGQDGTASYATITGSTIIYTPPPGTKRVYYRFWYHFMGVSESAISHHKIQVDGNDIYGSASCIASQYSTPHDHANFPVSVEYTMQIDMSSNDVNKGQFTSWTGPKTIRVMFREYNGSSYQCKLHQNEWWDGTGASGNYLIMKPHLTIRAIA
jgi:Flp pilus assembly protein TadG